MLSRVALLYGVRKVGRGTLCVGDSFGSVSCREAVKFHFTSLHFRGSSLKKMSYSMDKLQILWPTDLHRQRS